MEKLNSEAIEVNKDMRAWIDSNISPVVLQFLRYGIVSAVALAVDMGLLFVLTEYVGVNYLVSATLSFVFGLIVNYSMSIRYVFSNSRYDRSREFFLYSVIGLGGLMINDGVIYLLVRLNMWYMLAKVVSTGIGFLFNFMCRKALFVEEKGSEG